MANITITDGVGELTTTMAGVPWSSTATIHSFVFMNIGEGPARITLTSGHEDFVVRWTTIEGDRTNRSRLDPVRNDFVLDAGRGLFVTGQPTSVSAEVNNVFTIRAESLHTGIRSEGEIIQVALMADVGAASLIV